MKLFISIDDTDNKQSPGSGQLAELLVQELNECRLAADPTPVSRHQLFVHDLVPYTSHNSAMCFTVSVEQDRYRDVVAFSRQFLTCRSAEGSDPGLCVAEKKAIRGIETLIDFGARAKQMVLNKQHAYQTAAQAGVHLSEHGGSGDGVIGALAAVGLRLSGSDGRIRGWRSAGGIGEVLSVEQLCADLQVPWAVDERGMRLPGYARVTISDERIKTVLHDHCPVVPLGRSLQGEACWSTLTPDESKRY
jgi:hypothetical protein